MASIDKFETKVKFDFELCIPFKVQQIAQKSNLLSFALDAHGDAVKAISELREWFERHQNLIDQVSVECK